MAAVRHRDVTAAMLPTDNEEIHGAGINRAQDKSVGHGLARQVPRSLAKSSWYTSGLQMLV
jgi:hypothetical protein